MLENEAKGDSTELQLRQVGVEMMGDTTATGENLGVKTIIK
jgi:hypothetical protein